MTLHPMRYLENVVRGSGKVSPSYQLAGTSEDTQSFTQCQLRFKGQGIARADGIAESALSAGGRHKARLVVVESGIRQTSR